MTKYERSKKWRLENPERVLAYHRQWREKHPDKVLHYSRKYEMNNKERRLELRREYRQRNLEKLRAKGRAQSFKCNYGITQKERDEMVAARNNKCDICGGPFDRACIDHCHKTKKIRGILCDGCNLGLGKFKDDPERLRAAANYLELHERITYAD